MWNIQIKRQLGYSFSILHTLAYSVIALQELNLNHKFNPLYWQTACLSVNAGSADEDQDDEDSKSKSTDYGKIAYAIGNIQHRGIKVSLPDINKAGFGFTPDIENNAIIFGLKGINGIGDDVVHTIIENRPYKSFDDFIERMFNTGLIKKSQMIQLIKAGCFDSFGERMEIMKQFINLIYEPKEKLTMSNLKMMIENNLIPGDLQIYGRHFKFKEYISKNVYKTVSKPKDKLLLLDEIATPFFYEHYTDECIVEYNEKGNPIISEKQFKKQYDSKMTPIKEWLSTEEALNSLNKKLFENEWNKYCEGTVSKWEMDSLSYYYHEHELAHVNKDKYGIVDFNSLPKEPKVINEYNWRGREFKEYETYRIIGTVLDKNKNKHTVTLLTPEGVVIVKFYAGAFSHYNKTISTKQNGKKVVLEPSWFERGNKLLITGFRRENNFIPKTYKNSVYQHTVALINDVDEHGNLSLTLERVKV